MSIFSQMRRHRQESKEQNSKSDRRKEAAPTPYKHIPKHAASDSIAAAPSGSRDKDRSKVREENRKRSAMAAAQAHAHHLSMPGGSQVGSGFSSVSYSSSSATPMVHSPTAYGSSHSGSYSHTPTSVKGKEVDRNAWAAFYDMEDISPTTTQGGYAPRNSSRNSYYMSPETAYYASPRTDYYISPDTAYYVSGDHILNPRPPRSGRSVERSTERPSTAGTIPHRLHPSSRRTSESSIDRATINETPQVATAPAQSRESRPPPTSRKFKALPPTPLNPIKNSSDKRNSSRHSESRAPPSRRNSSASIPATPTRTIVVKKAEFTMLTPRAPSMNFDFQFNENSSKPASSQRDRRMSQPMHYRHDSGVDTNAEQVDLSVPRTRNRSRRDTVPAPSSKSKHESKRERRYESPAESKDSKDGSKSKSRRLSLSKGAKLLKTKRWSASKITSAMGF